MLHAGSSSSVVNFKHPSMQPWCGQCRSTLRIAGNTAAMTKAGNRIRPLLWQSHACEVWHVALCLTMPSTHPACPSGSHLPRSYEAGSKFGLCRARQPVRAKRNTQSKRSGSLSKKRTPSSQACRVGCRAARLTLASSRSTGISPSNLGKMVSHSLPRTLVCPRRTCCH